MKTVYRWLKPILCFAMLALLVSCATVYIPNDSTVGNMSVKEARKVLSAELMRKWGDSDPRVKVFVDGQSYPITGVRVTPTKVFVSNSSGRDRIFRSNELVHITHKYSYGIPDICTISLSNEIIFRPDCSVEAGWITKIPNALYVLRQNAIKQEKDAAEYAANFAASLTDYRKKAASNAALPEEANRYKVQAEGAVRDKAFDDAVDLYAEALKIAPWWPAGHFNRALVLGETGEYAEAMREMRRYLQLAPDAPNARAAQDKIYDWERLEAK